MMINARVELSLSTIYLNRISMVRLMSTNSHAYHLSLLIIKIISVRLIPSTWNVYGLANGHRSLYDVAMREYTVHVYLSQ